MKKNFLPTFFNRGVIALLYLLVEFIPSNAQPTADPGEMVGREKSKLFTTINNLNADKQVSNPVIRSVETQLTIIEDFIEGRRKVKSSEKDKAKRSTAFFLEEANKYLEIKKMHLYELNDATNAYKNVLTAILQQQELIPVLRTINKTASELVASSFSQYREHALLEDVATFKRVSSTPEFILQYLEAKPQFRFADSLLMEAVKNDPANVLYYFRKNRDNLQSKFASQSGSYIQQILAISNEKNAAELALFVPELQKGTLSSEEILEARAEPVSYFQFLVNTLGESRSSIASNLMRNGIHEKALAFFVNEINNLHNSGDAIRFASVSKLRPQDLYYIITTCGDELYTSSYLGLYKRLMSSFDTKSADSLFDMVQWENFDVFIRMAANYNVLDNFFQHLSEKKLYEVIQLFIGYIDSDPSTALEKAMDIADSFGNLHDSPAIMDLFQAQIRENLERCRSGKRLMGTRLYTILDNLLGLSREEQGEEKIWRKLGDYETLKEEAMRDQKDNVSEVVLFYGDEDGVASFQNFLRNYNDKATWKISRNNDFLTIQSVVNPRFTVYANLPLEMANKSDLQAQDKLYTYLQANAIEPSILVHRGHSYHLDKTLKRLTPSIQLAILGSCGGYNKSISLASINQDIQVIGSKKTGSKLINDPMLDVINESLATSKDLFWPEIWNRLSVRFKKDASLYSMFTEYFPPSHNLSLFVLKLYQSNKSLVAY